MIQRFAHVFNALTTIAVYVGFGVWYIYDQATCVPEGILGCIGQYWIPLAVFAFLALAATLSLVVIGVDTLLKRHYRYGVSR